MPIAPATVLELARAVTARGSSAMLVDEENTRAGWSPIEDAALDGVAFAVVIRDGLIVFDCDDGPDGGPALWAHVAREALLAIGCAAVRVASGSPGAEHWWLMGPVGWTSDRLRGCALAAGAPAGQLRWGERRCRPPLSPHRAGHPVALLDPVDVDEALERLRHRPGAVPLGPQWAHVLEHGDTSTAKYGGQRHRALMGYALGCVAAGLEQVDFEAAVRAATALGPKVAGPAGVKRLRSTWSNALEKVRLSPPQSQLDAKLGELEATLAGRAWRGRAGETDRRVFARLVEIARECGSVSLGHSQRKLEEELGISRRTVGTSLSRLREDGLLKVVWEGGPSSSAVFELRTESGVTFPNTRIWSPMDKPIGAIDRSFVLDAFRGRGALPRSAYDTYLATPLERYATVEEIALARPGNLARPTIRDQLRALAAYGLVVRNGKRGHRWCRLDVTDDEWRGIAAALGTQGRTDDLRALHAREREVLDLKIRAGGPGYSRYELDQLLRARSAAA